MRLGLSIGALGSSDLAATVDLAVEAERAGVDVVWVPEAYGADAVTTLSWIGARTSTIGLGAGVLQIPGRTPAMTAMTAAALDRLSGGRFRLGLGVSGPQVSEGWHGVRFADPLARTRAYVAIVRQALRRERLENAGDHYPLPLPGGGGKSLRLSITPLRADLPVYLGAIGPRNLELTGEIADGWLGILFSPEHGGDAIEHLRTGRSRVGRTLDGFDVAPSVPVAVGPDLEACADSVRAYVALYVGGMGSARQNFYNALVRRMGFADVAARVQAAYLDGRPRDAASELTVELLDAVALLGPLERVAERAQRYRDSGVTTVNVMPFADGPVAQAAVVRALSEVIA